MQGLLRGTALVVVLVLSGTASAHSFSCEKRVNGAGMASISSYPAELTWSFTVNNTHPSSASTLRTATDPLLAPHGWAFPKPLPFTLPAGCSYSFDFKQLIASYTDCLQLAASDGSVDGFFENTFSLGWDYGHTRCGAVLECKPPPPCADCLATRTLGFFKTHRDPLASCLALGTIDLGFVTIDSLEDALGLLYASPAFHDVDSGGGRRSRIDRLRVLLGRQTLVAICNNRLFGTPTEPPHLLSTALEALAGTDCHLIDSLIEPVDAYNNSGDDEPLPAGFEPGRATPRENKALADDPTSPSGDSC